MRTMRTARPLPDISVVITTYNRPDALEAVLAGCFAQDDLLFEIVVADDGSSAATGECIARLEAQAPLPLRHVWQPDQGFRAARVRNLGTLAAGGDYIVFLDGDCIPQRDFISRHRALARRGFMVTGSRILLGREVSARVLAHQVDVQSLGLFEKLRLRAAGEINKLAQLLVRWPDLGRERRRFSWRRIKGCNLGVWRSDLEAANGFDESFLGWGHEDADLALRLFNAGVLRKDGAFATEVFHLWHPEAPRDRESGNLRMVQERAANKVIRASRGLDGYRP